MLISTFSAKKIQRLLQSLSDGKTRYAGIFFVIKLSAKLSIPKVKYFEDSDEKLFYKLFTA
jgi:hypothetical protein